MPPAITAAATADLLAPTAQYKREAFKAVLSILLFIIVYFALFVLSIGLVALCVYLGVMLMLVKIHWLTILLGLGLIGCSVMVLVFQVKFLFASSKTDESDSIEITESDHPKLFQSIRSLSERIGTPMPKKVFLSPDVNAAVFYNSSFWSMFLPVRKNLKIGMGLVNAVNVSQLEAVIAHEFGHFSQRSMKIGSWSYQVNRIIFDMLYNNNGFAEKL
jgi:Zn-dependent protease with chaperone function